MFSVLADCRDLGIGVNLTVVGEHHQVTQGAVGSHGAVGHFIAGGFNIVGSVDGECQDSIAIREHGSLHTHHTSQGAVVDHLGVIPFAVLVVLAEPDVVLGVKIQFVIFTFREGIVRGGVGTAPEHDRIAVVGRRSRSQVGGSILGKLVDRPSSAVVRSGGHHDLGAVEQLLLLGRGELIISILLVQILKEPDPGSHGEVSVARDRGRHIAVAIVTNDLALGTHTAGHDTAGKVVLLTHVADVDRQTSVIVHRRLRAGVGIALYLSSLGTKGCWVAPTLGGAAGVGRQVSAAEQGGRTHTCQAGAGGTRAIPVASGILVVFIRARIVEVSRCDHRLIGDKQELGKEFNAHFAVDTHGMAAYLTVILVRKVGPGEEGVGGVAGKTAVEANLQGKDTVVKAQSTKGVDIALNAQGGEIVIHRVGLQVLFLPAGGVAHLIFVHSGSLEVQLHSDACGKGGRNGDGSHPSVDVGLEAQAGAGGHAAAHRAESPLTLIKVVVELTFIVALQLSADVQTGVGPVVLGLVDGADGVISSLCHVAQVVKGRHTHVQLCLHQAAARGKTARAVIKIVDIQAVVATPDEDVEYAAVLRGGDEHPEQRIAGLLEGVKRVQHTSDVLVEGVAHLVVGTKAELVIADAVGEATCHLHHQGLGIVVHQFHIGQIHHLEGHGDGLHEHVALVDAGRQALRRLRLQPAGIGHGILREHQGVGDDGDGGKGEGVHIHGLSLGGKTVLAGHQNIGFTQVVVHAPEHDAAGEFGVFVGAVGTHLAGGAQHTAHLQPLVGVLLGIGQGLGDEERLLRFSVGHLSEGDYGAAGAQLVVRGHGPLNVHQRGIVCIVVNVAQFEPVVQIRVGELPPVPVGTELSGVHIHRQLAVRVGGVGGVFTAVLEESGSVAQQGVV